MSQTRTNLLMEAGDVALEPLHREANIAIIPQDNQASSSSSETTRDPTGVSPVNNSSPLVDRQNESRPASPGQTSETRHESHAEKWQCPLNFTQTILALVALVLMAYLIKPQLADHALNKWSAAKDFRDDCRAQEAMNRSRAWECKKALEKTLPPPPTKFFIRSFARHASHILHMGLSRTVPVVVGSVILALSLFFIALFCLAETDPEQRSGQGDWLPVSDVAEEQYSSWVPNSLPRREESAPMTTGTHTIGDNVQRRTHLSLRRHIPRPRQPTLPKWPEGWCCCICQDVWTSALYEACKYDGHRPCLRCMSITIGKAMNLKRGGAAAGAAAGTTQTGYCARLSNGKAAEDEDAWLVVPRS